MQENLDDVLQRVGRLNYSWTNTESLLIHLIAGLAGVEKDVAVVIFLTLNTTRARIDLVDRLAKMPATPEDQRDAILAATSALAREGALRNRYNHCIYSFDADAGQVQTIMMRIQDRKRDIRMGKIQAVDDDALGDIDAAITRLDKLNRSIWDLVLRFDFPA